MRRAEWLPGAVSRSASTLDRPWQASPGSCAPHAHPTCSCLAVPPVLLPHQVSPPRAAHWISLLPFVPMKLPRVFHAVSRFILDNSCAKRTVRPSPENLEKQVTQNTIAPPPPIFPFIPFHFGRFALPTLNRAPKIFNRKLQKEFTGLKFRAVLRPAMKSCTATPIFPEV